MSSATWHAALSSMFVFAVGCASSEMESGDASTHAVASAVGEFARFPWPVPSHAIVTESITSKSSGIANRYDLRVERDKEGGGVILRFVRLPRCSGIDLDVFVDAEGSYRASDGWMWWDLPPSEAPKTVDEWFRPAKKRRVSVHAIIDATVEPTAKRLVEQLLECWHPWNLDPGQTATEPARITVEFAELPAIRVRTNHGPEPGRPTHVRYSVTTTTIDDEARAVLTESCKRVFAGLPNRRQFPDPLVLELHASEERDLIRGMDDPRPVEVSCRRRSFVGYGDGLRRREEGLWRLWFTWLDELDPVDSEQR